MQNKQMITTIVVAVIVGALGFFGGIKYSQGKTTKTPAAGQFANGANGAGRGNGAGGRRLNGNGNDFFSGTVLSKDSNSVTVQLRAGPGAASSTPSTGSKIVIFSKTSQISKTDAGTIDDLTVGKNVTVVGNDNPDGTVTANNIQIRNMPLNPNPRPGQ